HPRRRLTAGSRPGRYRPARASWGKVRPFTGRSLPQGGTTRGGPGVHDHRRAQRHADVHQLLDVVVAQADAAVADLLADAVGLVGAVDAELALTELGRVDVLALRVTRQAVGELAVGAVRVGRLEELGRVVRATRRRVLVGAETDRRVEDLLVDLERLEVEVAERHLDAEVVA